MPSSPLTSGLRLALVADNASIQKGGEAAIPFHLFSLMSQAGIDTWLLTHARNRTELEHAFPHRLDRILFIEDTIWHKALFQTSKFLPRRIAESTLLLLSALLTQYLSAKELRKLAATGAITLAHQPTPVSPRAPSLLTHLGIPLLIGPMNGGMDYPPTMRAGENALTGTLVVFGRSLSNFVHSLLPGKREAAMLLVANTRTQSSLPSHVRGEVILLPENGVIEADWITATPATPTPGRFLFVGRLVDWKRLDIVLKALARDPELSLDIAGDGAELATWQNLAQQLRLGHRVRFLGSLPQLECASLLRQSTALVLPSIYECGGAVVLEAMACGVPVIATQWGGPEEYVTADTGILIKPRGEEQMVQEFCAAMQALTNDPQRCQQLGANGRQRILDHYTWSAKVRALLELYDRVLTSTKANATT